MGENMKRKILSIILIIAILASCCSCANSKENEYAVSIDFESAQALYYSAVDYIRNHFKVKKSELKVRLAQYFTDGLCDLVIDCYYNVDDVSGFATIKNESVFDVTQSSLVCDSITNLEMIKSGVAKLVNRAYEVDNNAERYEDFYKACYYSEYLLIYDKTWKLASFGSVSSGDYLEDDLYVGEYNAISNKCSEQIELSVDENGIDSNGMDKDMHIHPWLVNHKYYYQSDKFRFKAGLSGHHGPVYLYDEDFRRSDEIFGNVDVKFIFIDNNCPAIAKTADNRIIRIWHEEFKEIYKSEQEILELSYSDGKLTFSEGDDLIVMNIDTLDVQKKHYEPISEETIDAMKALCLNEYPVDENRFIGSVHWEISEDLYYRSIESNQRQFILRIMSDKYEEEYWFFDCLYDEATEDITVSFGSFNDLIYMSETSRPYKQKELSLLQKEITEAVIPHITWYDELLKLCPIDTMTTYNHWDWNIDELEQNKWNVTIHRKNGTGAYMPIEVEVTKQNNEYLIEIIEDWYDPTF